MRCLGSCRLAKKHLNDTMYGAQGFAKKKTGADFEPVKWKPFKPSWLLQHDWKAYCDYWNTEDWLEKSKINARNLKCGANVEPSKHRGGSVSYAVHKAQMDWHFS